MNTFRKELIIISLFSFCLTLLSLINKLFLIKILFSPLIFIVVLNIFNNLSEEEKLKVSGTWSSLMSSERVYGSKFLLFSMMIFSFSNLFLLNGKKDLIFVFEKLANVLLIFIGFFPSILHNKDSLLFEEELNLSLFEEKLSLYIHCFSAGTYCLTILIIKTLKAFSIIDYIFLGISYVSFLIFIVLQIANIKKKIFENSFLNKSSIISELLLLVSLNI